MSDNRIEKFNLADFDFKSQKEYDAAEQDLKKIKQILRKVDCSNPENAARLYMIVRHRKIELQTGTMRNMFLRYLSDKMSVQRITEEEKTPHASAAHVQVRQPVRRAEPTGHYRWLIGIGSICIVLAGVLMGVFVYQQIQNQKSLKTAVALRTLYHRDAFSAAVVEEPPEPEETDGEIETDENGEPIEVEDDGSGESSEVTTAAPNPYADSAAYQAGVRNASLFDLYIANNETAGWISIPDTTIDYPVVRTDNNEYYLNHNFYGESDDCGTIFMDYRNNGETDTNILLYGHNRQDDAMFGGLLKYKEKAYFDAHPYIQLDTLQGRYRYRIIAVCLGEVAYKKDNSFRYYNFTSADTNQALEAFFVNIKTHSMYPVDYQLKTTDRFLTLSTCSNYMQNGRFYIVAVKEE